MSKRRRTSSITSKDREDDSLDSLEASTSSGPTMRKRKRHQDPVEICHQLYDIIRNHKNKDGSLLCDSFIRVPKRRQEPGYYEVVSNPMDLLKVQQKLRTDEYEDVDDLQHDIELIVNNTKAFYKRTTQEYKDATELWELFLSNKKQLLNIDEKDNTKRTANNNQTRNSTSRSMTKSDHRNNHPQQNHSKREKVEVKRNARNVNDSIATDDEEDDDDDDDEPNYFDELFKAVMTAKDENNKLLHTPFQVLPSKKKYPEYYEVVEQPIDLRMVHNKIKHDKYNHLIEMERDLLLMCKNTCLFNEPGSQIYKQAKALRKFVQMKRLEIDQRVTGGISATLASPSASSSKSNTPNRQQPFNSRSSGGSTPRLQHKRTSATPTPPSTPYPTTPLGSTRSGTLSASFLNSGGKLSGSSNTTIRAIRRGAGGRFASNDDPNASITLVHAKPKTPLLSSLQSSRLSDVRVPAHGSLGQDASMASIPDSNDPQWRLFDTVQTVTGSNGVPLAIPFWRLPSRKMYPDYYKEIKNPVSLGQIKRKLMNKAYGTVSEVAGDLTIMFENAKRYNTPTSKLYKDAVRLQKVMQAKVQELLDIDQDLDLTGGGAGGDGGRKRPGPRPRNYSPDTPVIHRQRGRPPRDSIPLKKRLITLAKYMLDCTCEDGRKPMLAFMEKPSKKLYPEYYEVIAEPIDFLEIESKIKAEQYSCEMDLVRDFRLMFSNCRQFNEENSPIFEDANRLEEYLLHKAGPLIRREQALNSPHKRRDTPRVYKPRKSTTPLERALRSLFETVRDYREPKDNRQLSSIFMRLPSKIDYPDYYEVIKQPIDMEKISAKLKTNGYESIDDLASDFVLMFDNACKFNEPDSQIYKDALVLQSVCVQHKQQLKTKVDDDSVPDVQAAVQDILLNLFTMVYNYQDDDGRCYSDSMADLPEHDEVDGKKIRALSLDLIKRRLDKGAYRRLDVFQEDFFACMDRARKLSKVDSQVFEDTIEMQTYYIRQRDLICKNGELLSSPALAFTVDMFNAAVEELKQSRLLTESLDDESCDADINTIIGVANNDGRESAEKAEETKSKDKECKQEKKNNESENKEESEGDKKEDKEDDKENETDVKTKEKVEEEELKHIKDDEKEEKDSQEKDEEKDSQEKDEEKDSEEKDEEETKEEADATEGDDEKAEAEEADKATEGAETSNKMMCKEDSRTFQVGEYVYVEAKEKGMDPHILCIERLWENAEGRQMLYGNYYLRPAETYHLTTRKFLEREVFKSDSHAPYPLDAVKDKCCVVNVKQYYTMKPEGYDDKDVYVVESRYNTRHRSFKKIKIFPENNTIKLVPRDVPLEPKRVMSIFRERVEKHKDELAELEEQEKLTEKEKPNVVCETLRMAGIEEGNIYYEQFNTVCSGVVKTGDFVYVVAEGGKQIIAQIDTIWETKDGKCYFRGPWFITPTDVPQTSGKLFYRQEVLLSTLEDANPIVSIIGRCAVLEYNDYITYRPTEIPESDIYICTSMYDEINRQIRKLPPEGIRKYHHRRTVTPDEIYFFPRILNPPKKSTKNKVVTGYILYSREVRKQVVQNNPESTFGDISRIVGAEWKALPQTEKQMWEERASRMNEETKQSMLAANAAAAAAAGDDVTVMGQCASPVPLVQQPPPDQVFECLWDKCDFQFEEVSDLIEHCIKDKEASPGHVHAYFAENPTTEFHCHWRNCARNRKGNPTPFPNITRLIRHIRDMHINKGNGRSVAPENRSKNFKPSSKPQAVNRPTPSATPNPPGGSSGGAASSTANAQKVGAASGATAGAAAAACASPPEPLFITVPPRPQRVFHSEAYIRYIEGLQADSKHITPWEKTLHATQENTPAPDPEKLKNVATWLGKKATDQHDNVVAALWNLRNQLLKDTLSLHKTL